MSRNSWLEKKQHEIFTPKNIANFTRSHGDDQASSEATNGLERTKILKRYIAILDSMA